MSVKFTRAPSAPNSRPGRGRADLPRLRRLTERQIRETSPPELAELPDDFWAGATVVEPVGKQPISLRVDADVLEWFKSQGPRYQSRINAVLRSYMHQRRQGEKRKAGQQRAGAGGAPRAGRESKQVAPRLSPGR